MQRANAEAPCHRSLSSSGATWLSIVMISPGGIVRTVVLVVLVELDEDVEVVAGAVGVGTAPPLEALVVLVVEVEVVAEWL